jgi:hypothetical protein
MRRIASRGAKGKRFARRCKLSVDEIIRRQRVHHLDKLFSVRYGDGLGDKHWQFPDDDAGLPDLKILLHHLQLPTRLRTISRYAPWADAEKVAQEIEACPQRYSSKQLGELVNLTGYEWRQYGIRTMKPVDMTEEQIEDYTRARREGQRIKKRRSKGVKTREQYLASHTLSKDKPWVAENISKATFYRRKKKAETSLAQVKLTTVVSELSHDNSSPTPSHALPPVEQTLALPDWSNHPMSALRLWSPGVSVSAFRKAA